MSDSGRRYTALCAIAKDETPYLREWIAYHYLIGFEKIFIYDNDSSTHVRDVVSDFYDAGIVDTLTIAGEGMQLTAYDHCLQAFGPEFFWMAFLDLDEFLVLKKEKDVRALLSDYEDYSGLTVNMCSFGSAGHLGRPAGLVMENYQERLDRDITVKSIVRPERVKMAFSPHDFVYTEGHAVNAEFFPSIGSYAPVSFGAVQLNHYSYRSQQDYEEKIQRGDAIYVGVNPRNQDKFLAQAKRKARKDSAILSHVPEVKKMLGEKVFRPYLSLDTASLTTEPLERVLLRLGSALRESKPELGRLIVKRTYRRFVGSGAFLSLAVKILLLCKDFAGAEKAARDVLLVSPGLGAYMQLFSVYTAWGNRDQAEKIGSFILHTASYQRDTAIKESIIQQAAQHGLRLE